MAIANIRGGGEYGPKWHQAALKQNRNKAYEDFICVGEDLIKQGVTTPSKLACKGGSNGGLLVGNMLTMRPDLFGAIVCQVHFARTVNERIWTRSWRLIFLACGVRCAVRLLGAIAGHEAIHPLACGRFVER